MKMTGKKIRSDGQHSYTVTVVDDVAEVSVMSNSSYLNRESTSQKMSFIVI